MKTLDHGPGAIGELVLQKALEEHGLPCPGLCFKSGHEPFVPFPDELLPRSLQILLPGPLLLPHGSRRRGLAFLALIVRFEDMTREHRRELEDLLVELDYLAFDVRDAHAVGGGHERLCEIELLGPRLEEASSFLERALSPLLADVELIALSL